MGLSTTHLIIFPGHHRLIFGTKLRTLAAAPTWAALSKASRDGMKMPKPEAAASPAAPAPQVTAESAQAKTTIDVRAKG